MNARLKRLMWNQFKVERVSYLALIGERDRGRAEMAVLAKRLNLLGQLLALYGRRVKPPDFVQDLQILCRRG